MFPLLNLGIGWVVSICVGGRRWLTFLDHAEIARLVSPFLGWGNVEVSVSQLPGVVVEQVLEEAFQIDGGVFYLFPHVLVVGAYQGIAEIPGVVGEGLVVDLEAYRAEVLYGKYGGGACVALAEGVYLPETGDELGEMLHHLVGVQAFVVEVAFLLQVEVESPKDVFVVEVTHGVAFQHPFFLCDVVVANLPGMGKDAFEDASMDGYEAVCGEGEGTRGQYSGNVARDLVGLFFAVGCALPCCAALVVGVEHLAGLVQGDLALDVLLSHMIEECRGFYAIDGLQTSGYAPVSGALLLLRFSLPNVFVKIHHRFLSVCLYLVDFLMVLISSVLIYFAKIRIFFDIAKKKFRC